MEKPKEVVVNDEVEIIEEDSFTPELEEGQDGFAVTFLVDK